MVERKPYFEDAVSSHLKNDSCPTFFCSPFFHFVRAFSNTVLLNYPLISSCYSCLVMGCVRGFCRNWGPGWIKSHRKPWTESTIRTWEVLRALPKVERGRQGGQCDTKSRLLFQPLPVPLSVGVVFASDIRYAIHGFCLLYVVKAKIFFFPLSY